MSIFYIGNSEYKVSSQSNKLEEISGSGIPALKSFCNLITAESTCNEAEDFLTSQLPGLINSIEIWFGALFKKETLTNKLQTVGATKLEESETLFTTAIDTAKSQLRETFRCKIISEMIEKQRSWNKSASEASENWQKWHHSPYAALCRRNGTHCHLRRGPEFWNKQLGRSQKRDMQRRWTDLKKGAEREFRDVVKTVQTRLKKLANCFKISEKLLKSIRFEQGNCSQNLKTLEFTTQKIIRELREKTLEDRNDSFLFDYMRPAYNAASHESGYGSHKRRKAIVKRKIDGGIFKQVQASLEANMAREINSSFAEAHKVMQKCMAGIHQNFRTSCGDLELPSGEYIASMEKLEGQVKGWRSAYRAIEKLLEEPNGR